MKTLHALRALPNARAVVNCDVAALLTLPLTSSDLGDAVFVGDFGGSRWPLAPAWFSLAR
jgi:hypothetical protein